MEQVNTIMTNNNRRWPLLKYLNLVGLSRRFVWWLSKRDQLVCAHVCFHGINREALLKSTELFLVTLDSPATCAQLTHETPIFTRF